MLTMKYLTLKTRLLALLLAMMMTLSLAACVKAPQTGVTDGSVYAFRVEK